MNLVEVDGRRNLQPCDRFARRRTGKRSTGDPLGRARETAEIVMSFIDAFRSSRIGEVSSGSWEVKLILTSTPCPVGSTAAADTAGFFARPTASHMKKRLDAPPRG
jgi:hypothetical protein